ncbi:unnamed protein product [Miscanthus lutarioriparius]|uniref:NB-ARC domain-containing protein n=1 Tax=Miscanthus lutarioriparius TaxID=422564 RepID=A0A811NGG8_9POAL|nr:unnamed protein product [Miscanthus lutarioriparius]
MEMLLSALLGEGITRSLNFFISKSSKLQPHDMEDGFHRVLLRAQVIIDEATGRHITNHAMLQKLDMLRGSMHRGYYMLDSFRYQFINGQDARDQIMSQSLSPSKVTYFKYFCHLKRKILIFEQLQKMLDNLRSMILDMEEVVIFLTSYRRSYRQPYSMHILLGNCMFGRQMEVELAINFLLHTQAQGPQELEVMPIVGPGKVGKSTLVAHVCKDERVRDRFSKILWLCDHDFKDDELAFIEECTVKLENLVTNLNKDERLLVVVELVGDPTEDAWNSLYSTSKRCMPRGSKIIVTSRSDKVVRFGTTRAITLKFLTQEAFWYFFKILVFGSVDPDMHPRLVQLAMEIAKMLKGFISGANVISSLLRDNFGIQFWYKVLTFFRGSIQKNISEFGEHPSDRLSQDRPAQLGRVSIPSEEVLVSHQYQYSSQKEIPKIGILDVVFGSIKPLGKFDMLLWRSHIPPYYSYVYACEIRELKIAGAKRKRPMRSGAALC